jgi:hypothetical protein
LEEEEKRTILPSGETRGGSGEAVPDPLGLGFPAAGVGEDGAVGGATLLNVRLGV